MILNFYENRESDPVEVIPRFFKFPDGQPHVTIDVEDFSIYEHVKILCSIRNPEELFNLLMIKEVLGRNANLHIQLCIYWLFGARMDREIDAKQPSTFKIIKDILSSNFQDVSILDLHNPKAYPLARELSVTVHLKAAFADFGDCDIFFPDEGAKKRYSGLPIFSDKNILYGKKKRDSQTGKLSGFELAGGERKSDSVLIVDDICAGGYTFFGQGEVLKSLGYIRMALSTTHGIYSGDASLLKDFFKIYSTNSYSFGLADNKLYLRIGKYDESSSSLIFNQVPFS